MSDIAIRVEGLSKQYRIGGRQERYRTLRDSISDTALAPFRRFRAALRHSGVISANGDETIWALKDVSFEVKRGEVVGIIGRNGSGKSTLLKILSRITGPTAGRAEIHGRVGSLLEVGTGFHAELTGRDNIYLNGAILGMKHAEIDRRFDEIVAFSEVERFIDTPVKYYSSGMYLRLAFGVAAHLDPEILLVDEVLAVGDAGFQKKCLWKMGDVAKQGRTVLFVSHNMTAVQSLCPVCVLLEMGRVKLTGTSAAVMNEYLGTALATDTAQRSLRSHPRRTGDSVPVMTEVTLLAHGGKVSSALRMWETLEIQVRFSSPVPIQPILGVVVKDIHGSPIFGINNRTTLEHQSLDTASRGTISCQFRNIPLMPGLYSVDLYFGNTYKDIDMIHDAASFEVLPKEMPGNRQLPPRSAGPVFWPAEYSVTGE